MISEKEQYFIDKIKSSEYNINMETGIITNKYGATIGSKHCDGFITISVKMPNGSYNAMPIHRLIWIMNNGPIPKGAYIRHKDGDKSNNALHNLELYIREKSPVKRRHVKKLDISKINFLTHKDVIDFGLELRIATVARKIGVKSVAIVSGMHFNLVKAIDLKRNNNLIQENSKNEPSLSTN
jgi:hypothetical protein